MYNKHTYTATLLKMSATEKVLRIENIHKYTQQYINGTLVLTPIEKDKEPIVEELCLSHENLTELPELPQTLQILICNDNNLTQLPETLPSNLKKLYCNGNNLNKLPETLPDSLEILCCSNNNISQLPKELPKNLRKLYICNNNIQILPDLPETLCEFEYNNNSFTDVSKPNCPYPDIRKYNILSEKIAYINRRNREMRDLSIVTEDWIRNTLPGELVPISCVVMKNDIIVSNLSANDITFADIANYILLHLSGIYGLINAISASKLIELVKRHHMSIKLIMTAPKWASPDKQYCYIYGM